MRFVLLLAAALSLAGCLASSGPGPNTSARDPDAPKSTCQATSIAGQPKEVCY